MMPVEVKLVVNIQGPNLFNYVIDNVVVVFTKVMRDLYLLL